MDPLSRPRHFPYFVPDKAIAAWSSSSVCRPREALCHLLWHQTKGLAPLEASPRCRYEVKERFGCPRNSGTCQQIKNSLHVVFRVELDLNTASVLVDDQVDLGPKHLPQPGLHVENVRVLLFRGCFT